MANNNGIWVSTVDNNTTNPDASGAGWIPLSTAAGSYLSLSVAGSANVTLTTVQAATSIINLTGALTANINLIVPTATGEWLIANNTTGAFTVTVKTAAGTGVVTTQGTANQYYCDGTNVYSVIAGITQTQADARYAALLGNTANKFSVAAGVAATDAVNLGQFTTGQVKTTTAGNQPLPGGVIIKSGYITGIGNGVLTTVTFPVAFQNGIEFAANIPAIFNNVGQTAPTASAAGAASFQFTNSTGITNNFYWFAIGY
jgi:hypothetical protein